MGLAKVVGGLPFMDPKIRWRVYSSLDYVKIITGNTPTTNSIQYSCDNAICIPRYYGGFLSWYDPSVGGLGNRMFNLQEAWDYNNRTNPNTAAPYDGKSLFIPGYGGFFLAVSLTDGTNKVQVNIIRRYIDDTILIYNTGKYGGTATNISVIVYDPPSELGYKIDTNGTRGAGQTTLAPGQYILFYKSSTAPAVDTTTGLFKTSPFGVNKMWAYELWVSSFRWDKKIEVPKMYLGIKAPGSDMEIITNGSYPGVSVLGYQSGTSDQFWYPLVAWGGSDAWAGSATTAYNVSGLVMDTIFKVWIYKADPNTTAWDGGHCPFAMWFGWGEDDTGNVKFILLSSFLILVDTNFNERIREYIAYIYDVDRGEAYVTHIVRPTVDTHSYGRKYAEIFTPVFTTMRPEGTPSSASAFAYIDKNDVWTKRTTAVTSTTYIYESYGFCNFFSNKINCTEGLGIYGTDPNYTPPAPKAAYGAVIEANQIGAVFPRVASIADLTLVAGAIYAVVTRMKTFPSTTTDTDLQNWFKSLPPKALSDSDFNALLGVLPGSFWLFGTLVEEGSISVPDTITPGGQFTVNVSCPTRPNTDVWVALVDQNGNIVTSGSGVTDANGNASITLTAPSGTAEYRVLAIIKGSRTLEPKQ